MRRQLGHAAQGDGVLPLGVQGVVELQIRQSLEQHLERLVRLDSSQLRAQAKMDAATERQRLYRSAGYGITLLSGLAGLPLWD